LSLEGGRNKKVVLLIKYAVDGKFLPVVGTGSNSSGKYQILGFAKTSL
jgi:hypothetical protein